MTNLKDDAQLFQLIRDWELSPITIMQRTGSRYYIGDHDIRYPNKTAGKVRYALVNGQKKILTNMVNSIIVDNIYSEMVDQKVNYLFSKPLLVESTNEQTKEALNNLFGREFLATIKSLAIEFLNCGIAYLYPYYTSDGLFKLAVFSGSEIIPFWKDDSHKELEYAIRIYTVSEYIDGSYMDVKYATVFKKESSITYKIDDQIKFVSESPYVVSSNPYKFFEWGKVPIIPFKSNSGEIPLLQRCKSLQDNLNMVLSVYQDALLETQDTSLIAVTGAGGENPAELRQNISTYRLVYLQNTDSVSSDVKTLQMEVKKENYELMVKMLRRSIVENCRGFEMKDEKSSGNNLNEMNIKSMYINLDLDANNIETEFQYSIYQLLYFFNVHFKANGLPTFNIHDVSILTDRDTIVNVESQIQMAVSLYGKVSLKTFLSMLSVVDNVEEEYKRIMEEGTYQMKLENVEKNIQKEGTAS